MEDSLRKEIKDLDAKIDTQMDKLGTKVDRILYIVAGAAVIGGLVGGLIKMFVK